MPVIPSDFPHKRAARRLFYDTETSGLPGKGQPTHHPLYPTVMELTFILEIDSVRDGKTYVKMFSSTLAYGEDHTYEVADKAFEAHRLTRQNCEDLGVPAYTGMSTFLKALSLADQLIGHNHKHFDNNLMLALGHRTDPNYAVDKLFTEFARVKHLDTLMDNTDILRIPGRFGYKWPNLQEAHTAWCGKAFDGAHTSAGDVAAVRRIYNTMLPPTL